mmetsp:Transcript_9692/g.15564  ORF Transcript_9692/g.15564 Transcript_9692/m.15564 type:complete len:294 (+) Transcript_9692:884-1765(+)
MACNNRPQGHPQPRGHGQPGSDGASPGAHGPRRRHTGRHRHGHVPLLSVHKPSVPPRDPTHFELVLRVPPSRAGVPCERRASGTAKGIHERDGREEQEVHPRPRAQQPRGLPHIHRPGRASRNTSVEDDRRHPRPSALVTSGAHLRGVRRDRGQRQAAHQRQQPVMGHLHRLGLHQRQTGLLLPRHPGQHRGFARREDRQYSRSQQRQHHAQRDHRCGHHQRLRAGRQAPSAQPHHGSRRRHRVGGAEGPGGCRRAHAGGAAVEVQPSAWWGGGGGEAALSAGPHQRQRSRHR